MAIEELNEEIEIGECVDNIERDFNGWYHVSDNNGVFAYFRDLADAKVFKQTYINFMVNGIHYANPEEISLINKYKK